MEENQKRVNVVTLFQKAGLTSHDVAVDPEQLRGVVVGLYFSAHWYAQRAVSHLMSYLHSAGFLYAACIL